MLAYDGNTARVDIVISSMADGKTVYISGVYDLVWEDGDWKLLPTDPSDPMRFAQIPDLAGYVPWGQ